MLSHWQYRLAGHFRIAFPAPPINSTADIWQVVSVNSGICTRSIVGVYLLHGPWRRACALEQRVALPLSLLQRIVIVIHIIVVVVPKFAPPCAVWVLHLAAANTVNQISEYIGHCWPL